MGKLHENLRAIVGEEVEIVLLWRSAAMPENEQRTSALKALCEDLAEICDWETAVWKDARVLLHA